MLHYIVRQFVELCFNWIKLHCNLIRQLLFIGTGGWSVTHSSHFSNPSHRRAAKLAKRDPVPVRAGRSPSFSSMLTFLCARGWQKPGHPLLFWTHDGEPRYLQSQNDWPCQCAEIEKGKRDVCGLIRPKAKQYNTIQPCNKNNKSIQCLCTHDAETYV